MRGKSNTFEFSQRQVTMLDAGWPPPTPRSHGHRAGHGALAYAARPFSASASASSRPPSSHWLRRSLSTSGTECRRISTQMCAWRRTCPCRRSSESGARWSCGQPFASRSAVCGCSFGARKRRAALGAGAPAPALLRAPSTAPSSSRRLGSRPRRPRRRQHGRRRRLLAVADALAAFCPRRRREPKLTDTALVHEQLGAQRSVRAGA